MWLAERPHDLKLTVPLGTLRTCFDRLTEWDGDDIPARVLVFPGDLPLRDDPLPRFLNDAAFTKLLQAARAAGDPFVRLCVEFLARTGLRKVNSSISQSIPWCRSVPRTGCTCRWGSCAPTATSRCIPN